MKYVHTNLIAADWKKLAQFYIDVFDCRPTYPERDLSGEWIDKATRIKNVRIRGMHLRLPGYTVGEGPTLEIFKYKQANLRDIPPDINRQGLGHIAFEVDSVDDVLNRLLQHGGTQLGEVIVNRYENIGVLTMVYARDPEGNIIEIQKWQR